MFNYSLKEKEPPSLIKSLTRVMSVGIILVFIVMISSLSFYGGHILKSLTNERLNYIISAQADNIVQSLWEIEISQVETILKNLAEDKNIKAVRVRELTGKDFETVVKINWDNKFNRKHIYSEDIIYKYEDGKDRVLGKLEVAIDYKSIELEIQKIIWGACLLFGIMFVVLGVSIYYLLRQGIMPITELSKSLVGVDYFTHKIKKKGRTSKEVDNLFNTLIKMQNIMQGQTKQIQEQKTFLDTLIKNLPMALIAKDIEDKYRYVAFNREAENMFGVNADDIIGATTHKMVSVTSKELMVADDKKVVSEKANIQIRQRELFTDVKGRFVAKIYKIPIYDDNGKPIILLTLIEDITEQIRKHEELEQAKNQAEKANKAKSEFLANMSHELRTPLNSIIGLASFMLEDGAKDEEQRDMLSTVATSSNNLLATVNSVLDLSKIEANKIELEVIELNLKKCIDDVVDTLKPLASKKSVTISYNWKTKDIPNVYGDGTRISRIITNLTSNAIKFTQEGYIKLNFDIRETSQNKLEFYFSVEDTGAGIPEDKIDKIFDKFSQADNSITRRFGGTGLGLTITKNLVEMMGGIIGVESKINMGSTFTVKIPLEKSISEGFANKEEVKNNITSIKNNSDNKISFNMARILIVEDQILNQDFIKKLVGRIGSKNYNVAGDGVEAVEMFKKNSYDLIIMDCHMPNMTGYDATRVIRELEKNGNAERSTPIVAMTADAMVGTREKCLASGMDDYISKPVNREKFEEILSRWFIV